MSRTVLRWFLFALFSWAAIGRSANGLAADLATAPSDELMRVYGQLRSLQAGDRWAAAENVVWKRDAATFTFRQGRLTFAAPVGGRIVAAVFTGQGSFSLDPPTPIAQRQLARFTKTPKLEDDFREAVFFFTDNSWEELQKLVAVRAGGNNQVPAGALENTQKKLATSFNDWWENRRDGNPNLRNVAARMLADLTDPTSRGFLLVDFKGERLGNLLFHISWNRDPLLFPGLSTDEEVMLVHNKRNEYSEWWAGFHLREEYARTPYPEHRDLLAHCREERIEAEVRKDNRLSATAEMGYEVPAGMARVLPLHLNGVLRINSMKDGEGRKLAFIQEDRRLDHDPWMILPEPAVAEKVYKLKIDYQEDSTGDSRIIHEQGSGLYFVTSRESWYPSFGAFDDRTHFILHIRSPKKFVLVGTGRPLSSEKTRDALETTWESEIPYSVVGFNYGDFVSKSESNPRLTVTAYTGKEIPDELKGLQSAIDSAQLAAGTGSGGVASRLGVMTGGFNTRSMVGNAAAVSFQALQLFEHYFGPLPFKNVSVTEQPVRGFGQSWPTLIFLPYDSLLDATTRHSLRLQDTAEAREFYNVVAVHEMAHQWWGHLVGWTTYHDQWLSEGFAEFSAALYLRKFDPKRWNSFWDLKRRGLLSKNRQGHRPIDVGPLWLGAQLPAHLEEGLYQELVYFKGAYVLEMLRTLMEDPKSPEPDTRFIGMMRYFVTTYSGKNASTEDFRRIVEKHTREPMDWFFNEWVYGTEVPHYDFSYELKDAPGGKTVLHVSLSQSGVSDSFQMRLPLYVHAQGEVSRLGFISVKGSSTSSGEVSLPFRPEKVTLDDFRSVLCTVRQ